MFKITEIRELIRLIDETSISELQVESAGTKLSIKKPEVPVTYASVQVPTASALDKQVIQAPIYTAVGAPAAPAAAAAQAAEPKDHEETVRHTPVDETSFVKIVSPMVGTFYSAPSPEAAAYVRVGDKVTEKTVVCIVEAMKLMNEIEADVRGEIVSVLVENGQLVEYGQPMFLVKPE